MRIGIRSSKEKSDRLDSRLGYLKCRHSAMLDSLLDLNKRWKNLNEDQILAYNESRDNDVTRYDVLIRSVDIDTERVYKKLDKINKQIEAVVSQLKETQQVLRHNTSSKWITTQKAKSIRLPFIICGSDPSSVILAKQSRLSGRKERALLRCLELVNDLKSIDARLSSPSRSPTQCKHESVRARFKQDELSLQLKYMALQEDKLIQLDIELFDIVIDEFKSTIMVAKEKKKRLFQK